MVDHANAPTFSDEFRLSRNALKNATFSKDWGKLIKSINVLLGETGPNASHASALSDLRRRIVKSSRKTSKEDEGILRGTGDFDPDAGPTTGVTAKTAKKAASIKFLRHLYMLRKFGSHKVWICSLPKSFGKWPNGEIDGAGLALLRMKLADIDERFSAEDKKHLSHATQEGLRWCHKTLILLASAQKGKEKNRDVVKRWFADENATDEEIDGMIATLAAGFKKITAVIKSGGLVLTDHPIYRGTEWEGSEAFVTAGAKRDGLDVVYIESAFFGTQNLLTGLTNWTRILVHELTHREAATVDVPGKYAWGGIKPNAATFPSAKAITNADSWAWFCADAAGALTEANRNDALKIS